MNDIMGKFCVIRDCETDLPIIVKIHFEPSDIQKAPSLAGLKEGDPASLIAVLDELSAWLKAQRSPLTVSAEFDPACPEGRCQI